MRSIGQKVVWILAVVLFALSAAFDVLGGIGTICAAFFPEKYPPLWSVIDYKWIYQVFVFVTLGLGLVGVWFTLALFREGGKAYKKALILLLVGVVFGGIRVFTSLAIRGKAAPTNVNWYLHIVTLIVFLLFQLPMLKDWIRSPGKGDGRFKEVGAGLASISVGLFLLTSMIWAAPSHTYQGVNWAEVLDVHVYVTGSLLFITGIYCLAAPKLRKSYLAMRDVYQRLAIPGFRPKI